MTLIRSMAGCLLSATVLVGWIVPGRPGDARAAEVLGWMEGAKLYPGGIPLNAKLDTGADHSSLDADDIAVINKSGREWVRFTVTGQDGKQTTLERPFLRTARIKGRSMDLRKRPVVSMRICVGGVFREVEVNLTDRTHFRCPLIIGRSFLLGLVIVDPGRRYTKDPKCARAEQP